MAQYVIVINNLQHVLYFYGGVMAKWFVGTSLISARLGIQTLSLK